MAHELTDAEYASMLAAIFFHGLSRHPKDGEIDEDIQDAIYQAVRQVFKDRLAIDLPQERPPPFWRRAQQR